ncbi:MAG: hypothetical protein A2176_10135 [Spirochaetes bacterium RBG_13_51_14]|nr:MAG: hypothetical protein A2176_10135 [Spirochaetes bacterium RBG_13_51_14]
MITGIFLRNIFEETGCHVIGVVPSGEEVIECVRHVTPDFIVMDIKLDGLLDGIETAIKIRKEYDIPILFLSASTDEDSINRAMATNPMDYLPKPINTMKLKSIIEALMGREDIYRIPCGSHGRRVQ